MPIRITGTNDKMTRLVMLDSENVVHLHVFNHKYLHYHLSLITLYTECPRRNVPYFGRVFLMLKYTDKTQNTYVQS
jgi:hypothetical protein